MKNDIRKLWDENKGYELGRLVCSKLPLTTQPYWAAQILRLVVNKINLNHDLIDETIELAENESLWNKGHKLFSKVRRKTISLDIKKVSLRKEEDNILLWVFNLAELVAKVSYNASKPLDEFDDDTCYWIVVSILGFVNYWKEDMSFNREAYKIIKS